MHNVFTKILISVFMVGVFLLPLIGQIQIKNSELTVKIEVQKVSAQAHGDAGYYFKWTGNTNDALDFNWYGPVDTETECGTFQDEIENNGNTILEGCSYLDDTQADKTISQSNTGEKYSLRSDAENQKKDPDFGCHILPLPTILKCFNELLYYVIFSPLAWIMTISGELLDYFIFYSTSDEAYRSGFIGKAWGAVRDISNILFIVALLFIAIKTVLSINVSNNKKLVGTVVIMALLINFSLFTTQVVVDVSNILARVFYNEITAKGKSGAAVGASEEKSVSLALVSIFNPQNIIDGEEPKDNPGSYLVIILLAIVVVAITIYVFVSVAFLFVARVIGLWVAMIFSPIAFASRTVSFKIPAFSWGEWFDDLLKYSFLAPIFVFFLYIIVLLADSLKGLVGFSSQQGEVWVTSFMNVLIPFVLISVLLLKARDLAVSMSGKIGQNVMSAVKTVGGFAGGAALGAVAFGGSKMIGGVASRFLGKNGEALREQAKEGGMSGYMARMQLKAANYGTKATFDARQTVAGNKLSNLSGMNFQSSKAIGLGSKAGGYTGMVERKTEQLTKESELYKTKMTNNEVEKWSEEREFKYYKDRDEAKKNNTLDSFEKSRGKEPPKKYTSADELNHDRMKAFQDNIGHSGLMGSMIYSTVKTVNKENYNNSEEYKTAHKKEEHDAERRAAILEHGRTGGDAVFDEKAFEEKFANDYQAKHFGAGKELNFNEDIAKKINKKRVQEAKIIVGAVAGLATGGALGAGAFGLVGGIAGSQAGGIGGALLGFNDQVATDAAKKFGGTLAKEEKRLKGIQDRIDELKNVLSGQEKDRNEGLSMTINGVTMGENGKISSERIEEALAFKELEKKQNEDKLKKLMEETSGIDPNTVLVPEKMKLDALKAQQVAFRKDITEISKLNKIKDVEERIANTKVKVHNLSESKHAAEHKPSASNSKVNVVTPKASSSSHSEPHAEEHHEEKHEESHEEKGGDAAHH